MIPESNADYQMFLVYDRMLQNKMSDDDLLVSWASAANRRRANYGALSP